MKRFFPSTKNILVLVVVLQLFVLLQLVSPSWQQDKTTSVTVYSKNNYVMNTEDYLKGAAVAKLVDSVESSGWSQLNVSTNANLFSDEEQMYAAGMAEGLISYYQTWQLYQNQVYDWNFTESTGSVKRVPSSNYVYPKGIINFLTQNNAWMRKEAIQRKNHCKFWYHVNLMMNQLDGLVDGYLSAQQRDSRIPANKYLDWFDLLVLQAAGDMYTLVDAFGNSLMKASINTKVRAEAFAAGISMDVFQSNAFTRKYREEPPYTECSALIKVTSSPQQKCDNIFVGHTTWRRYNIINKFFKTLTIPLKFVAAKTLTMSSSASFFSSKEDYLAMDSGLVALETSLSTYNTSLFSLIKPDTLLSWVRSVVASRLAYTSKEWIDTFSKFSSGTYNNQWMSLDMKKFKPGTCELEKDTLWIIEEIPGGANQKADVSSVVNSQGGYWPSYNIPYFPEIYNILGYAEAKKKFGNEMDYKLCPRSKIFAREQSKIVSDWKSFGRVLQFNEWQTDEFSQGDPAKSIAARYDLRPTNGQFKPAAFGGADTKLTSYNHVMNTATGKPVTFGMAGPTHQEQSPFSWNDNRWNPIPHMGQPNTYDFDWVQFNN